MNTLGHTYEDKTWSISLKSKPSQVKSLINSLTAQWFLVSSQGNSDKTPVLGLTSKFLFIIII